MPEIHVTVLDELLMTTIFVFAANVDDVAPLCEECDECLTIEDGDDGWADTILIDEE